MAKREIYAVHEHDLGRFLGSLGLLEALEAGKIRCAICKCQVTKENFGSLYPFEGGIKVCCDKSDCYSEVIRRVRKE